MKKGSSQRGNNPYQYKYLPLVLQGAGKKIFVKPSANQVAGDIGIGYIKNSNLIYHLYLKEIVQHFLVVGRSGAGKTNLFRVIMVELYNLGIPFIAFDLAKLGTRHLKKKLPKLLILRPGIEFFFNALETPVGVKQKEWIMSFCEITAEIFDIRTASKMYLDETVRTVLKKFKNPTMHNLKTELNNLKKEKLPRNEIGYINVICNKINPLCNALDDCLNVNKGIPIEKLLNHPVGIELVGIKSSEIQMWLMCMILAWITSYRETLPMQFGKLKHVFFFDEAGKVLGKGES
jgi:hypothetical protein